MKKRIKSKEIVKNTLTARLDLICGKDDMRPSLQHIFIDEGMAIATNANAMAIFDLSTCIKDVEILRHLEGKLIHSKQVQLMHGQLILPIKEDDIQNNTIHILHKRFGMVCITLRNNITDGEEAYPDYKKVLPNKEAFINTKSFGVDSSHLTNLINAIKLSPNSVTANHFKIDIISPTKPIVVTPICEEYGRTYGFVMPVMLVER